MAEYQVNVAATSNSSANTFDEFIELKAASGTSITLKRVRVSFIATTPADNLCQIKITRNSAAGTFTSGTSYTPLKLRQNSPASTVTATIKNSTNAAQVGTITDTPVYDGVNTRSVYEWIAADQEEWIESVVAQYIAISLAVSAASFQCNVTAIWEE